MGEYLTSFCGDADAYGLGLQIMLTVIADRFFVSINQDGKDPVYVDAFPETLKKHRIAYTQEDVEPNELPVMRSIRRPPDKLVGRDDRLYVSLSTAKPGKAAVSTEYES